MTDPLEEAWSALEAQWDQPDRHKAFVALAAELARLQDAAGYYRRAAERDPARVEAAEQARQLILARALAQLETAPRASREDAARRARWLLPLAAVGLLVAASFLLASATRQRAFVSPPVLALELVLVALLPWRRFLG